MEKRQQLLLEERLREAASLGDNDEIVKLLNLGVEINSRNQVNGWSPLHWACKRGQVKSVGILLERDADKTIETNSGETPDQLTTKTEIHQMLGVTPESIASPTTLPITPNYLQHSIATYTTYNGGEQRSEVNPPSHPSKPIATTNNDELVLKVRVASALESDFIEVELDLANLTFQNLIEVCCRELYIKPELLVKVRKLPNTIVRKDKDVQRFHDFQELEFVLRKTTVDNHAVPFQNQSIYY
ncbi:ankyrin repeat domain-containing protein 40-like [Antedon mediterranea]|uniref:ankyrin repeat domain-containing protein 40-like n=1 Tax=Antedon mediterranea TaxID=105859 RepID=UPI003AF47E12